MPLFEDGRVRVDLDDQGFMQSPDSWNDKVAAALARDEGIEELTDEHWQIIDYLREYQEDHGNAPMIRQLCKDTGFTLKRIYELFENGPAKGACRVAGLPRPDSCV